MRVVICGAGIGGLVLAQALQGACDVTVVERDPDAVSTGGYRLAINAPACAVLTRVLDAELMAQVRAVSDGADRFAQFTVATNRLRPLIIAPEEASQDRLLAQRRALRLLLTRGLETSILWSSSVARVEARPHGAVVHLGDGRRLDADLVVGAEGAISPTVRAATSAPTSRDLRLTGIAGSALRVAGAAIPRFLQRGPALAFDAAGTGMFLSLTSAGSGTVSAELRDAIGPPALVWGLIAPARVIGDTRRMTPTDLMDASIRATARWHPWLRAQIDRSDPGRVAAFPFRAAEPRSDLTPWHPEHITALGDAIHAMPPTGGQAASTAIRDAGCLARNILGHLRTGVSLPVALQRYHDELPRWAVPALRESLGPVRVIRALGNPVASAVARPALVLAGALARPGSLDL